MKKIIVRVLIGIVLLVLVVALSIHLFLDGVIKRSVETTGPKLTKTDIKLGLVNISLFSGSGKLKDLFIGNPAGFKTPSAIQVASTSVVLDPKSIFGDKVIVRTINVQNPEITLESDLKSVNLKKILSNLEDASGSGSAEHPAQPEAKAGKKLQVDDFLISGGKIHISITPLGQSTTVPLPEIHLTNLGTNPEGITGAELAKIVLREIVKVAEEKAASMNFDISKGAQFLSKDLDTNTVNKVSKGLGDLFKKKN
jgi:AsmA-like protein